MLCVFASICYDRYIITTLNSLSCYSKQLNILITKAYQCELSKGDCQTFFTFNPNKLIVTAEQFEG